VKYKIKYDYHTHTAYSHGKGTIEENVRVAASKGLQGIAISDHGPGHVLFGIDRKKVADMREEIEELRSVFADIEIFLSVEANILNVGKRLDLDEAEFSYYDFIIAGYHYGVRNGSCTANFLYSRCPLWFPGSQKLKNKNTDMVVRAIYENPIKILTHPGDKGHFDIYEIAKACGERGTFLEINENHRQLNAEGIRTAAKADVRFIISSDAHRPGRVGACESSVKIALEAGLDMCRIVNLAEY